MNRKKPINQKLTFIFFLFLALFNYPLLGLFNKYVPAGSFPVLYVYIFLIWILLIIGTAFTVRGKSE